MLYPHPYDEYSRSYLDCHSQVYLDHLPCHANQNHRAIPNYIVRYIQDREWGQMVLPHRQEYLGLKNKELSQDFLFGLAY